MIASDTVLLRAQDIVCRALRSYPFAIRAALPVDPDDPPDVRLWLTRTLDAGKLGRFHGPPTGLVRRLRWTALDAARRVRRKLPRGRDDRVLQLPDDSTLDGVVDRPPWKIEWADALENLAADAASAARSIVSAVPQGIQRRKALAVLSCLARTVAAVQANQGTKVAAHYAERLMLEPDFIGLPLAPDRRQHFRDAMAVLNAKATVMPPGVRVNLRRMLRAAGEPWAQTHPWKEFSQAFDRQRRLRLQSRQPPP